MYWSPYSYISVTRLISCLQGCGVLVCTFGPPVSTLSFLSWDCPWTYRCILSLGVQARPRSGQMWMSQGGRPQSQWGCKLRMTILALCSWQGQFQGAFCIVAQRISSGSYPFSKVSFLPSLTPPTSSFCVPGIVSKISSLYSILKYLLKASILDALASESLLTKEKQPSQG